jgi:hypothetical protein
VPASIKLLEEYGDDINVIFVESQGADRDTFEAFALQMKWLGKGALWTEERPVQVEGNTLPKFALLGADGTLLLSGNPLAMKKQIEESIAQQVDAAKPGSDLPKALADIHATYDKGKLAEALLAAETLADETDDEALADLATETWKSLKTRTERRVDRLTALVEDGWILEADAELKVLVKGLEGDEVLSEKVGVIATRFDAGNYDREREAQKALASVEKKLFEKPNKKLVGKLENVAEKYEGTRAAERAARYAMLLELRVR